MFERLANGWELAKQSFRVLMLDKELLLFPLFSGISCLAVLASFALPLYNTEFGQALFNEDEIAQNPVAWILLFAFYVANYFVIVFFNSALVACAIIRFKGGDPTVADGFRAAGKRIHVIFLWALVSATVGLILRVIESRSEKVGRFVAGLMGAAWSIATYFVVPVLVVENKSPGEALSRSWKVLKKTWGEAIGANFGIGLIVFVCSLVCFAPILGGGYLIAQGMVALGVVAIVLGVIGLILMSLVSSALESITLAALYLYAAEDEVPAGIDGRLMRSAFAPAGGE